MRKRLVLLPVVLVFLTAGVSCGPKEHAGHELGAAETQSASPALPEAAKYVCPMHPDVQSDRPGQCPKCGMDLKSLAAFGAHDHSTHQH